MFRLALVLVLTLVPTLSLSPAMARESLWTSSTYAKSFLETYKDLGWVMLRKEDGHDWVYFSTLLWMRCALKEVRYSVNSEALDQVFPPMACDLKRPSNLPVTARLSDISIKTGGPVETISVQATFADGSKSDMLTYGHCAGDDSKTCAVRLH